MKPFDKTTVLRIRATFSRFYLSLLCVLALATLSILANHECLKLDNNFGRLCLLLVCGFFSSLSTQLFAESRSWGLVKTVSTSAFLFLCLFLFLFYVSAYCWHALFLVPGLALSPLVVPYLLKKTDDMDLCHFICSAGMNVFFASVEALILYVGLLLLLASIDYLLGFAIKPDVYVDALIVVGVFFTPFTVLHAIPRVFHFPKSQQQEYPKAILFIVAYILSPLLLCYFAILYAYIVLIIIQWDLPKGRIAYIITLFGALGVITHFLICALRAKSNVLMHYIHRYFYYVLLAPIGLLVIGIATRIKEYGITEQRYAIVLAAMWLLLSAGWLLFTKNKQLKAIPLFASGLLILASVGPWGAVAMSSRSQLYRLKEALQKNHLLVDGKIVAASAIIPDEERENIHSIIEYFISRESVDQIRYWFASDSYINTISSDELLTAHGIMDDIGLLDNRPGHFNFYADSVEWRIVDIRAFDYWITLDTDTRPSVDRWTYVLTSDDGLVRNLSIDITEGTLKVTDDISNTVAFDLSEPIEALRSGGDYYDDVPEAEQHHFIIDKDFNNFHAVLYLRHISGKIVDGHYRINHISLSLLINYTADVVT